ncbi:hypothetical protein [Streptomyces diastaticus]|uniref:hypothetical protein n=1 Tax=Streptomyces diastaticus TaxID=1956 RepID=UPI0035D79398
MCGESSPGARPPAPGALAVGADVEDGGRALLGEGGEGGTPKGAGAAPDGSRSAGPPVAAEAGRCR